MTDAERKLWQVLRRLPLDGSHFRRQATIGPFFADFACHELRLVIEVDGGQHNEHAHAIADAKRTEFLNSQGYRVLRFWNNDVLSNPEGVVTVIQSAVHEARHAPHPRPLPTALRAGGGETPAARPSPQGKAEPLLREEQP
jgi:very-short-patch-repair endonuclease